MYSLDDVLRRFAQFLNASWGAVVAISTAMDEMDSTELISDWVQANWEILVETHFRELVGFGKSYLQHYGDGADCNESSSRVWRPLSTPTHRVVCQAIESAPMLDLLTNQLIDVSQGSVVFDHFAAKSEDGWHEQAPPFDCVLGYQNDREVLIRANQVVFFVDNIMS